ncbi:hypothetical protein POTOM_022306 [Populus tomentosa]|uniref:Uncharacterized protein n=1 Tax=Populus tomentosa TaxID=118781 RepID=A0A8X7ZGF7_POPTO|nr:hypothetical protein POTOM_022306 [Populus tomentosa]
MDLLAADDRQIRNPNDFPLHLIPFPPTGNFDISTSAAAVVGSSDVDSLLPQKLRPIRGNGRVPSGSGEDGREKLWGFVSGEASDVAVNGGGGLGLGSGEGRKVAMCLVVCNGDCLCSCDGNADDSSVGAGESVGRKRKRRSKRKIEKFLESLVMKVMEKQEEMHKQLVEMIESRERETMIREEAWKQQEMERMKRDNEARAQETSRNLALISFIHNMTGHAIEAPKGPIFGMQYLMKCAIWATTVPQRTAKRNGKTSTSTSKSQVGSVAKKPFENITGSPCFHELDVLYNNGFVNLGNSSTNTGNQANCTLGKG